MLAAAVLPAAARAADGTPLGEYDVVVVGSGAAGMTAALTAAKRGLSVLVVEKAPTFGGSAARSGAGIWLPNNSVILGAGVPDTPAKAAAYLSAVVGPDVPADRQQAFLANGPRMLDFVMANSPLRFRFMEGYSDYYPNLPGGLPNGRSIEPDQIDGHVLGAELAHLNPAYMPVPAGMVVFSQDYKWLNLAAVTARGLAVSTECLARGTKAALRGEKPLTMGQALATGLRAGLQRAGVPVWLNSPWSIWCGRAARSPGWWWRRRAYGASCAPARGSSSARAASSTTRRCGRGTSSSRSAPSGRWARRRTRATASGRANAPGAALGLMEDAWWGGRRSRCPASRTSVSPNGPCRAG
ncbi:hypothetical protein GCM10020254_72200 [Streptomyces goshikiensis]